MDRENVSTRPYFSITGSLTIIIVIVLGVYWINREFVRSKEAPNRACCQANLAAMYKAIHLYVNEYGKYPPCSGQQFLNYFRGKCGGSNPPDWYIWDHVYVCPSTWNNVSPTAMDYKGPSMKGLGNKFLTPAVLPKRIIAADASLKNHLGEGGHVLRFDGTVEWLDAEQFKLVDTVE